ARLAGAATLSVVVHLLSRLLDGCLVALGVHLARLASGGDDALAREGIREPCGGDLARRAALVAAARGLRAEGRAQCVMLGVGVDEIAAADLRRGLQLAVDAPVALLQSRRVPGQVEVQEIVAAGLQVDALARRRCRGGSAAVRKRDRR